MRLWTSLAVAALSFTLGCGESPALDGSTCPITPYGVGACADLAGEVESWVQSHLSCNVDSDCTVDLEGFMYNSTSCTAAPPDNVTCWGYDINKTGLPGLESLADQMRQARCEGNSVCTGGFSPPRCCQGVCRSENDC